MVPSACQAIVCVLFCFIGAVCAQSQVAPVKTATISGKVTLKNKGLAGVVVAASHSDSSRSDQSRYRATTDQTGKYRITNVLPGTYQIAPLSPGLVLEDELFQKSLVIEEGDNVEDVNFSMFRGGVITGKITDADGKPMVEELIFLQPLDEPYAQTPYYNSGTLTDDRGVYRAFGLHAGKYKVYVGQGDNRMPGTKRVHRQTFYPSVTDSTKATIVEVTEGGEVGDIDIMMGRPFTAFKVTGKIVDGETGKPVPHVRYGILEITGEGMSSSTTGASSNANGEFKFEGVMPGKYSVFIESEQNTEVRADPVPFEVIDHDVTGLMVKTVKGSSVSGVVVMEGVEDPAAIAKLGTLFVHTMYERGEIQIDGGPFGLVGPDGSFRIRGLSPGVLNFTFSAHGPGISKQLALVRIERDGVVQPSGVSLKDGEQIAGLRLTVKTLTATIRGQVKVEDGELPANTRMSIWVRPLDEGRSTNTDSNPQIDSRGRFLIEGLAGGTYEINIAVFEEGRWDSSRLFKQQVTVADNSVSDVTVTIRLKP
jgi:protocatechuate 3,4-dioxygenase beta subunit